MQKFRLIIAIPEKQLFEGKTESVTVPGEEGEMTILADHTPLLSTLKTGKVKVAVDSNEEIFEIESGFIEVNENGVTVLAKKLVPKEEDAPK